MARLIWIGPSRSASPSRRQPGDQRRARCRCTMPKARPSDRPGWAETSEVLLQPAVGDQVAGGGDDGPGRRQGPRVEAAGGRADDPERQQQRPGRAAAPNADRPARAEPARRPSTDRGSSAAGRGDAARVASAGSHWRARRDRVAPGDGLLEAPVVQVRGVERLVARSPWPAGRWSPGARAIGVGPSRRDVGDARRCRPATRVRPRRQALVLDVVALRDPLLGVLVDPPPGPRPTPRRTSRERGRLAGVLEHRRSARRGGRRRPAGPCAIVVAPSLPYLVEVALDLRRRRAGDLDLLAGERVRRRRRRCSAARPA